MSEPPIPSAKPPEVELARERTKQAGIAGWTAGLSAFFAIGALTASPSWPVAAGIAALATMITVVCCRILLH